MAFAWEAIYHHISMLNTIHYKHKGHIAITIDMLYWKHINQNNKGHKTVRL